MISRIASAAAAVSLFAAGSLVLALPAAAQEGNPGTAQCAADGRGPGNANPNAYPPAQDEGGVSDENAERGQQMSASSGCAQFAPGRSVAFGVESTYQKLGDVLADASGEANATFAVPTNLANGQHHVVFTGPGLDGQTNTVRVAFQVTGGPTGVSNAPSRVSNAGGLPMTGSDELIALTVAGLTLVVAGAGLVVVARRRRASSQTAF